MTGPKVLFDLFRGFPISFYHVLLPWSRVAPRSLGNPFSNDWRILREKPSVAALREGGHWPPVASFHIRSLRRRIISRIFRCDGGKNHQSSRRQSGTGPMIYCFQITEPSGSKYVAPSLAACSAAPLRRRSYSSLLNLNFDVAAGTVRHGHIHGWSICVVVIILSVRQRHNDVELDDAADCSSQIVACSIFYQALKSGVLVSGNLTVAVLAQGNQTSTIGVVPYFACARQYAF